MNLTTATPVEIDTALADLFLLYAKAETSTRSRLDTLHYALGERLTSNRRTRGTWPSSDAAAIAAMQDRAGERFIRYGATGAELLAKVDAARAEVARLGAEIDRYEGEFRRRGGWSRFYSTRGSDAHTHKTRSCPTCNRLGRLTDFEWNPKLSGKTEAEAVAALGPIMCTVCFPSAPTEWTIGKPKPQGCTGSRVPNTMSEIGMRRYATCTCGSREIVNADGKLRRHKPKASAAK